MVCCVQVVKFSYADEVASHQVSVTVMVKSELFLFSPSLKSVVPRSRNHYQICVVGEAQTGNEG